MNIRYVAVGLVLAVLVSASAALGQPDTDLYLAELVPSGASFTAGEPRNLTDRAGYDNQPYFLPDTSGLLFTSYRDGQADVYRYTFADGAITQVTDTPESEYSPTVTPDGQCFTVVRVEADSTQRLWRFDLDGGSPELILPNVRGVGYHAWGYDNAVGLFILGDPPTFQVVDLKDGRPKTVAENVGISVQRIPLQRAISFVNKVRDTWYIDRYDVPTGTINPITPTLADSDHHAWMPDGTTVLQADGAVVYAWEPQGRTWTKVADFSDAGVTNITRLAVSPDGRHLAFVAER